MVRMNGALTAAWPFVARRVTMWMKLPVAEGDLFRIFPFARGVLRRSAQSRLTLLRAGSGRASGPLDDCGPCGGSVTGTSCSPGSGHARAAGDPNLRHLGAAGSIVTSLEL